MELLDAVLNTVDLKTLIAVVAGGLGALIVLAGKALLKALRKLVLKTPTKIDDDFLEAVVQAVKDRV